MAAAMITFSTTLFQNVSHAPRRIWEYFYAYERFRKFKNLDPHIMQDIGVTQSDLEQVSYADFLR